MEQTRLHSNSKAVVLLSGGMDSVVAAAIAKAEGRKLYAISFAYGQRHVKELQFAGKLAHFLGVAEHILFEFDLRKWGGSALTADIEIPLDRLMPDGIPITYVPARNTIFLSFALAYAEVIQADAIVIGVNQVDYSGYPDCRAEYLQAFEAMANLATKTAVEGRRISILAPLLNLSKAQIIKRGIELGVDFALTWSCYQGQDKPCGRCDSCLLRERGFREAGIPDPLLTFETFPPP